MNCILPGCKKHAQAWAYGTGKGWPKGIRAPFCGEHLGKELAAGMVELERPDLPAVAIVPPKPARIWDWRKVWNH